MIMVWRSYKRRMISMLKAYKRRIVLGVVSGLMAVFLIGSSAVGQLLFGLGEEYPGGTLKVTYEMLRSDSNMIHKIVVEVVPNGNLFDVITTLIGPGQEADSISTGFGGSGAAGAVGARYEEDEVADIDLSPLQALDERNVAVEPNQNYYLPDGARLVTQERTQIAGIDAVMGVFVHPNYPNQRVQIALPDPETSKLLLFPPLMITEVNGEVDNRIELVEFTHTP